MMRYLLAAILSFTINAIIASHIKGGYITARRIDRLSLTYEITFVGYRNSESAVEFGGGVLDLGDGTSIDGTSEEFEIKETRITPFVVRAEFIVVHTYAANRTFIISYTESFRNSEIANMENSINTSFHVWTKIVIDPLIINDNLPSIQSDLIFEAAAGREFISHWNLRDTVEKDVIVYDFRIPQQSRGVDVFGYRFPDDPDFYEDYGKGNQEQNGAPVFRIDPLTGTITWDAPGDIFNLPQGYCPEDEEGCSEYTIAVLAKERRFVEGEWILLSEILLDFQIVVVPEKEGPRIILFDELCSGSGEIIEFTVESQRPFVIDISSEQIISSINGILPQEAEQMEFDGDQSFAVQFSESAENFDIAGLEMYMKADGYTYPEPFASFGVIYSEDCQSLYSSPIILGVADAMLRSDKIRIYPNPVENDIINIDITDYHNKELNLRIFSIGGEILLRGKLSDPVTSFTLSGNIKPGVYHIQLISGKGHLIKSSKVIWQ